MSRWSDSKVPERPSLPQTTIEGTFQCQTCNEYVDLAVYLPTEQILTWKCSQGHKSFLEKFKI